MNTLILTASMPMSCVNESSSRADSYVLSTLALKMLTASVAK